VFDTLITTVELGARLGAPGLVIVDVRHDLAQPQTWGHDQYRQGHLPGAVFAHLDRDLSGSTNGVNGRHPLPSPEAAAAVFGRLGIDESKQVVAYDQGSGMLASRLWWMLRWLGHDAAAVLDGGYAKWIKEGRPVTTDVGPPQPATFSIRRVAPTLDVAAVEANLGNASHLLIDARAPERFRGEVEPMDRVPGHIPGAVNRPYAQNLNADATFKPAPALRSEFETLLAGRPASSIVHQCGSGVSACHNLLAMEISGLRGSLLYPGSWSEWCTDPARPVARGEQ
jgi:thiosulfate/3-mercaptopyruvate sulfurtransferase